MLTRIGGNAEIASYPRHRLGWVKKQMPSTNQRASLKRHGVNARDTSGLKRFQEPPWLLNADVTRG